MATDTQISLIGHTIGHLRIVSEIGRGGMGIVYLAEHIKLQRRFAVKSLAPELTQKSQFRDRFYQEARNQALLDHPNIVQATDFFDTDGQFFLVMENVDGEDLGTLIRTEGKLPEKQALRIIKGVLEGLNFAHKKGIIHRDIKPSNILLDSDGRPRITDFGIAILVGDERLTQTGVTVGSPWYMSPEQIIHPQDIDHRSDVYSAGILLYEMLTGEVPFDGETDYSIKNQQINSAPPDPIQKNPDLNPELAKIVLKTIRKDPADRFQGCEDFFKAIEDLEKIIVPVSPKRWLLWTLTAIALVSIGATVYLRFFQPPVVIEGDKSKIVIVPQNSKKEVERQHKMAFNLIRSASEKALSICREFENAQKKRDSLPAAQALGDTQLIDDLNTQIRDHKRNIGKAISSYNDFISQLDKLKEEIVNIEFEKYGRYLKQQQSFEQISRTRSLKNHYNRYMTNRKSVNRKMMLRACGYSGEKHKKPIF